MKHMEWVKSKVKEQRKSAYRSKDEHLKWLYGISYEEYLGMYEEQLGRCAICNNKESAMSRNKKSKKALSVDHCHTSGKIRSLLCGRCNTGLGMFLEDVETLRSAIAYLEKHGTEDA